MIYLYHPIPFPFLWPRIWYLKKIDRYSQEHRDTFQGWDFLMLLKLVSNVICDVICVTFINQICLSNTAYTTRSNGTAYTSGPPEFIRGFNGGGVVFLSLLLFVVVFVFRLFFLPSVFLKVCFITPLNLLSFFDYMTIAMDTSMYRKHIWYVYTEPNYCKRI